MKVNHWSIEVDSDKPITGVIAINSVPGLYEAIWQGIDLGFEAHCRECEEEEHDMCYEGRGDVLAGDWKRNDEGKYYPDENGEYAAIVSEIYTQVVFSQHTKRTALCSPCYPGQGDLDSEGEFLTYDFPPDMYREV